MKKEPILDLMNNLPADLVEEADVERPAKRRLLRVVRTGLIAACLCLALLGSTFAAVYYFSVQAYSSEEHTGYRVYGDWGRYPVDKFSAQLLADCEAWDEGNPIQPQFDTWAEAKAYLGNDIPCVWPEGVMEDLTVQSPFPYHPIRLCLWQNRDNDNRLVGVEAYCSGIYTDNRTGRIIKPYIELGIATEYLPDMNGSMGGLDGNPKETIEQLGDYPMPNGSTAGVVMMAYELEDCVLYNCIANFAKDGIRYQVTVFSAGYPELTEDIEADVKTILDLFP